MYKRQSFKGEAEALRNPPQGSGGLENPLGDGRWEAANGSVYFLKEENGELTWELEG